MPASADSFRFATHVAFEITIYILGIACMLHAGKRGRAAVCTLIALMLYGMCMELLGLHPKQLVVPQDYRYGQFLIVLFRTTQAALPLCIVVAWGIIAYTGIATAEKLGAMPWAARPLIVALLGLSTDLIMDPVASGPGGLAMWRWSNTAGDFHWLQVPLTNFIGWYVVLTTIAFYTLLGRRLAPPAQRGWPAAIGIPALSVVLGLATNALIMLVYGRYILAHAWEPLVLLVPAVCAAGLLLRYAHTFRRDHRPDWVILAVPLFIYSFFFVAYILTGMFVSARSLLLVAPPVIALGTLAYAWPYLKAPAARLQTTST